MRGRGALLRLLLACLPVVGVWAQASSPLDDAMARARRLVNEGAGAAGRAVVDSALAAAVPGSTDEATALFWRASLAETWESAQRDYLRLMLDFDGSAIAGEAMLRLAQGELVRGDREAALQYLERLARETPNAPVRAEAAVWQGRLLLEQGDTTACAVLRDGRARVPRGAADLVTRYEVLLISCANLAAAPVDTAEPPPPPVPAVASRSRVPTAAAASPPTPAAPSVTEPPSTPSSTPSPTPPSTPAPRSATWTVQLGAYATREQALAVARRLGAGPPEVRVDEVPGGPYAFKVRFGRFATRAEAETAAAAHTRRTGGATFVTEAPR